MASVTSRADDLSNIAPGELRPLYPTVATSWFALEPCIQICKTLTKFSYHVLCFVYRVYSTKDVVCTPWIDVDSPWNKYKLTRLTGTVLIPDTELGLTCGVGVVLYLAEVDARKIAPGDSPPEVRSPASDISRKFAPPVTYLVTLRRPPQDFSCDFSRDPLRYCW